MSVEAGAGEQTGDLQQVLVLLALCEDARGDRAAAVAQLERAITLAEPEGYVRLFLDEGPRLRPLLEAVAANGAAATYIGRILD